jgi:hypothetical protein
MYTERVLCIWNVLSVDRRGGPGQGDGEKFLARRLPPAVYLALVQD